MLENKPGNQDMGRLYKRKYASGRESYSYRYFYGQRHRRITFGPVSKRQAEEWYHEAEALLRRSVDPREYWKDDTRIEDVSPTKSDDRSDSVYVKCLSTIIDQYLDSSENKGNRPDTIKRKRFLLQHFLDHVGDVDIKSITTEDIEKWLMAYGSGKSAVTKHGGFREVRALFIWAEKRAIILRSPHRAVSIKTPNHSVKPIFSKADLKKIFEEVEPSNPLYRPIIIALHTGMRSSEVVGLQWADIDFEHGLIHLRSTKSRKHQTVPIAPELAVLLQGWKSAGFPKPVHYNCTSNLAHDFADLRDKLCLEKNLTFHAIRRTVATELIANGASVFWVSKLLRHSSVKVTEDSYAHVLKEPIRETAIKMAGLIQLFNVCD